MNTDIGDSFAWIVKWINIATVKAVKALLIAEILTPSSPLN
ncbi:MAG TPA: hypothetical protein V6D28_12540 [Leptolyngbyaceae cyanobacterium]